ncbi:hypothetical protein HNR40_007007 [Nonomuraea endophytica]|uniref:Uncharacterized protein n=1 Tax=Nonomuraea endophytica TaxID=714136 RepID=A0A7W8A8D5_9ACTN|nr:hypothetical protein [Nonomuraea endophytica]MBB5081512.1 hypothetical protein [Nonomuraea endophytica]
MAIPMDWTGAEIDASMSKTPVHLGGDVSQPLLIMVRQSHRPGYPISDPRQGLNAGELQR